MGTQDQSQGSEDMGKGYWEELRILQPSLGVWAGGWSWVWGLYAESRADPRDGGSKEAPGINVG